MDVSFLPVTFSWRDILDITLVAILFYNLIVVVKQTRAVAAVYGLLVLIIGYFVSRFLGLTTMLWLLENILNSLFLLIVIVFQKDIRHALASLGTKKWWSRFFKKKQASALDLTILCQAAEYMAERKIGALIVIEGKVPLGDSLERGVMIDAGISRELLINLFWPNSPMHDGAIIIRQGRVVAGGCILPLSTAATKRDYGTRHRAALGITEETDAIVLVVSEERGVVAVAVNGRLTGDLAGEKLLRVLTSAVENTL